jgi:GH18 family chitinase
MTTLKKQILKFPILLIILTVFSLNSCFSNKSSSYENLTPNEVTSETTFTEKRIVTYLPWWNWDHAVNNTLKLEKVTHVYLAFANPDANGNFSIQISDSKINSFVEKAHALGVKVLISIGGGNSPAIYDTLFSDNNVQNTVDKLISYTQKYRLDGIDVDLEGERITRDYQNFITTLSNSLPNQNMLLTAALAKWTGDRITDTALSKFDFINIMAYDKTGPWNPTNKGAHSTYQYAVENISYWVNTRKLPANKACLGVPFYGYDFTKTPNEMGIAYSDIIFQHPASWNDDSISQLYYNGAQTIKNKALLAKQYGGIMIWEISQDAIGTRSLLDVIFTAMQ